MATEDYLDLASWATMDPKLKEAACEGDKEFLKDAISSKPPEYFLSRYVPSEQEDPSCAGNIFHLAVWHQKQEFLEEAMNTLPKEVVDLLLCQQETAGHLLKWNPLHLAVFRRNARLVYVFVKLTKERGMEPFTAKDSQGRTPALLAIQLREEHCATSLLECQVPEKVMEIADNEGNSPLFLAVQQDLQHFIDFYGNWNPWRQCVGPNGSTALHVAPKVTDGKIRRQVLSRCTRCLTVTDNDGSTVLHTWVKIGDANVLKQCMDYFSPSDNIPRMIVSIDKDGNNPLHLTASSDFKAHATKVAEELVTLYHRSTTPPELRQNHQWPWQMKNNNGDTPFILSIRHRREELALYLLSLDPINSLSSDNQENPLILAINNACDQVVQHIFDLIPQHERLTSLILSNGAKILHFPSKNLERVMKEVIEKFPSVINQPDNDGKTLLDKASEANAAWLVELLLSKDPSSMNKAPTAWKKACEEGHVSVILSFVKCPHFRGFCFGNRTTPLHYIQLTSYAQNKEFILSHEIIEAMKNTQDEDGKTPLHKSIQDNNIDLAEALLTTDGIRLSLKDTSGKTAMDLLADICSPDNEWGKMCKRLGIDPRLKTTYVQRGTDLLEMRGALSVVAGLLATITFTAGFTLPGGFDQNTGEAMLAKNAAFFIFLLADTYAMCCSMLVLFCLMWSMISDSSKSLVLIDYSMKIVLHSLCATLVAFMTGVFTVIVHKSLWAGVIVFMMCTFIGISATIRRILFSFVDKAAPNEDTNDGCQNPMLKLLGNICKPKQKSSQESSATDSIASPV